VFDSIGGRFTVFGVLEKVTAFDGVVPTALLVKIGTVVKFGGNQ